MYGAYTDFAWSMGYEVGTLYNQCICIRFWLISKSHVIPGMSSWCVQNLKKKKIDDELKKKREEKMQRVKGKDRERDRKVWRLFDRYMES